MLFTMPQAAQDPPAATGSLPSWPGTSANNAKLVQHMIEHDMRNGEVFRLDGAFQLAP
jgi:hypothetical protein